ncbi:MAG TPA: hypothetical protein VFV99_07250 [Kofleriaceae bacterium]|nr:hypothetical protein [Kofleriaceae bacterium]
MSRFALIGLVLSGCFYTDPINQRPSLDIVRLPPVADPYRGDMVSLKANANDPEGYNVWFKWRAYACTDESDCDHAPYFEKSDERIDLMVPMDRDPTSTGAVRAIHVFLEGVDDYGATARPIQQLWIGVADHAPTLELRAGSGYGNVVNTPINVYAKVGDQDDKPETPQLSWIVYTPTNNPAYEFVDITVPDDGDTKHKQYGKRITPHGTGKFTIEVTADDLLGSPTSTVTQTIELNVGDDRAPCLRQLTPLVATAPAALPMAEPTLFQVHVVEDDLDPYPTINDTILGTTQFTWSLLAPGGSRQVLTGVTGNSVALDPASYQPGDILELRVEIADRVPRQIMCADSNATCSVISDNSCLQRQTWRVEVR